MAHGNTRSKSRAIVAFAKWFHETHAPDVRVVAFAVTLLSAMRSMSKTSVCTLFERAFMEPYGDAIRRRDESFFLTAPVPAETPPAMAGVTAGVHTAWERMAPADKDATWDRLATVVEL